MPKQKRNAESDSFSLYGEVYTVKSECSEFVTAIFPDGTLRTRPNGRAFKALMKAVYGTNDRAGGSSDDPAQARINRAEALEEMFFACIGLTKGVPVHHDSTLAFFDAFAETIRQAVYEEEEAKAISLIKNAFVPAVMSLRRKWITARSDAPRNNVHRVVRALDIGCRYYQANDFQRPSKRFIQEELERHDLGFFSEATSKTRQLWRNFWTNCGLGDLPD
jgi:hypothetical protein